jgi:hypothetical protein
MPLVIMTGASGSGKTAIAKAIEVGQPSILVFRFDTIGVPSADVMASFGTAHQPGGAWQRAMTLKWFERRLLYWQQLAQNRSWPWQLERSGITNICRPPMPKFDPLASINVCSFELAENCVRNCRPNRKERQPCASLDGYKRAALSV